MHFDDDDYYAPGYIEFMLEALRSGLDFVKLGSFFLYSQHFQRFAYWELANTSLPCAVWSRTAGATPCWRCRG